jgi:hypothetical protein
VTEDDKQSKAPGSKTTSQSPPASPKRDPWGCMAGTVIIMPGVDLTSPTDTWNAEEGRLFK